MTQEQKDFCLDANNYYRMGLKLMLDMMREVDGINEANNIPEDMQEKQFILAWGVIGKHLSRSLQLMGYDRKHTEKVMVNVFKELKD